LMYRFEIIISIDYLEPLQKKNKIVSRLKKTTSS
jgi:hypothetical protein